MNITDTRAAVFVQTNEEGENRVVAYGRSEDGTLNELARTRPAATATASRI